MTEWNNIVQMSKKFIRAITPITGTTVNAYVEVVDLDTRWLGDTNFTIANTAAVNGLTYKVTGFNDYGSGIEHEITENAVALSDDDMVILKRHARVKVYVKSTTPDAHTTYQVDCIAG